VRDDVQYYRDLYNLERVEALKAERDDLRPRRRGGVVNRVTKEAGFAPFREITLLGGSYGTRGSRRTSTSRSTIGWPFG